MTNLLVLTEARKDEKALSPYQKNIFLRVLEHAEKVCGKFDDVQLIGTDNPKAVIEKTTDSHVLLVGSNHAELIHDFTNMSIRNLHGPSLYGILTNYKNRRIIATPYMSDYGIAEEATVVRASLLGHLYRHLELLHTGLIGWNNPGAPSFYRLVRNMKDWRELQHLLETKRIVCIDSETSKGLQRIGNSLLTLQFGFDGKTGWVLPITHPESPLSSTELKTILAFLKDYFERHPKVITVFHNAIFDLHQLIDLLKLRWFNHKVYDTSAGQFNLDESYEARRMIGYKKGELWSLERLCLEAGMDHYHRTKLGKSDRTRLETKPLEEVAEYAGVDVVLPIRLMRMQRAIAKFRNEHIPGRPYERFDKNVIEVDGVKIIQMTFLERNGLKVDLDYVLSLNGNSGVFLEEIKKSEANFRKQPAVLEANALVLKQNNVRSSTLFGKKGDAGAFVFNVKKREHQIILFDKVVKLKALVLGVGGLPKYDKYFKDKYKDNPVVAAFGDLIEALALHANFIAGFYKILRGSPDNKDGRLHTIFKFLEIKTGRCLAPFSKVLTTEGEKEIKDVVVGDMVLTHLGNWRRISNTWIKGSEEMLCLKLSNGRELVGTKGHRVLLSNGKWISLGEIEKIMKNKK